MRVGTERAARHGRADLEVHERRQVHQELGQARNGPGEFRTPHSLAFDSRGRLFVADRGNVRLQIFDQEGKFLEQTLAFSRLSGIYIDKNDMLYGADSESSVDVATQANWKRGIRIGSAKDLQGDARSSRIPTIADPAKTTSAPARPRASSSTPRATSTARRSGRGDQELREEVGKSALAGVDPALGDAGAGSS